jgi:polyphenol oxidase
MTNPKMYQSRHLLKLPGVVHGYSARKSGDMRLRDNRRTFIQSLGLEPDGLVTAKQIHGNVVRHVTGATKSIVYDADGLFLLRAEREKGLSSVGVIVGDCVPILFADTKGRAVAAVHAGWKGTLENIAGETVSQFTQNGIHPEDIMVSVGPHICRDCYTVPEERAKLFLHRYGNDRKMAYIRKELWHLDIGYLNLRQLEKAGIPGIHIDTLDKCTASDTREFFSYRKDADHEYGEIIGVVGFST